MDKLIARFGSIANRYIEWQDKRVVETQLPKKSELHMHECLVQSDMPIMEYRTKREKLKSQILKVKKHFLKTR